MSAFSELRQQGFMAPIFDLAGDDPSFVRKMALLYVDNVDIELLGLFEAIQFEDLELIKSKAHRLKSFISVYNLPGLTQKLNTIEDSLTLDLGNLNRELDWIKKEMLVIKLLLTEEFSNL